MERKPQPKPCPGAIVRVYVLACLGGGLGAGAGGTTGYAAAEPGTCVAPLAPIAALVAAPAVPETRLKAVYLILFTRYVSWPQATFGSTGTPLVFGVVGNDPLAADLAGEARSLTDARPIEVRRITDPKEVASCHALFVGRAESRNEEAWIAAAKHKPILTVGESTRTLAHGAVLLLTLGGRKPEFEIDWSAMERAGLRISTEMLKRASEVHHRPSANP